MTASLLSSPGLFSVFITIIIIIIIIIIGIEQMLWFYLKNKCNCCAMLYRKQRFKRWNKLFQNILKNLSFFPLKKNYSYELSPAFISTNFHELSPSIIKNLFTGVAPHDQFLESHFFLLRCYLAINLDNWKKFKGMLLQTVKRWINFQKTLKKNLLSALVIHLYHLKT